MKSKVIQSFVFNKKYWKLKEAKDFLRMKGYKTDVDEKPETYRFRQFDPWRHKSGKFITRRSKFHKGLQYIIAI